MTHPNHSHFLLSCEEGLPSGMSGGRLTTFLDFAFSPEKHRDAYKAVNI